MNFFNKIFTFLKEVKTEIKKVNWPSSQQTIRYTLIVLIFCLFTSIFLGSIDFIFTKFFLNRFILK